MERVTNTGNGSAVQLSRWLLIFVAACALLWGQLSAGGTGAAQADPAKPGDVSTASGKSADSAGGRAKLRVTGDTLNKKATLVLRGTSGKAKGYRKTVRLSQSKTVSNLRPGVYKVRAKAINASGSKAVATVTPKKARLKKNGKIKFTARYQFEAPEDAIQHGITVNNVPVPGESAQQIAISADGSTVYNAILDTGEVVVIDARDPSRPIRTITGVGTRPSGIALSSDGKSLYVSSSTDSTIAVLDTATLQLKTTITLPTNSRPSRLVAVQTQNREEIWAISTNNRSAGTNVYVVDTATNSFISTINLSVPGTRPAMKAIAFNPRTDEVWVTADNGYYFVGDAQTRSFGPIQQATTPSPTATNPSPTVPDLTGIAFSADGQLAWMSDNANNRVFSITTAGLRESQGTPVAERANALAVSPDGQTLWVASEGKALTVTDRGVVTPIDTATGVAGTPVSYNGTPYGVAVSPKGDQVWTGNLFGVRDPNSGKITLAISVLELAPPPPTDVKGVAGDGEVTVSWTPPASNGVAVVGYVVQSQPGDKRCSPKGTATSCVVKGLKNGQQYTFVVTAIGDRANSDLSAPSAPVTPSVNPQPTPTSSPSASPTASPTPTVGPTPTIRVKALPRGSKVRSNRTNTLVKAVVTGSTSTKVTTACVLQGNTLKAKAAKEACAIKVKKATTKQVRVKAKPTCNVGVRIKVKITAKNGSGTKDTWTRSWAVGGKKRVHCQVNANG